jgi:hypothetical protein
MRGEEEGRGSKLLKKRKSMLVFFSLSAERVFVVLFASMKYYIL